MTSDEFATGAMEPETAGAVGIGTPSAEGQGEQETPGDTEVAQRRPWIRFLARGIDVNIWLFLVFTLYYALKPVLPRIPELAVTMIALFLYNFVEAVSFALYGTTIGKWFLKVYVRTATGEAPGFSRALGRVFGIWIKGLALGIPLLNLIAMGAAFARLQENGITDWDREGRFRVSHGRVGALRSIITALLVAGWLAMTIIGVVMQRSAAA